MLISIVQAYATWPNAALYMLAELQESMIDLEAPLARSAAARHRLKLLETSLAVRGLCDNLPTGVSYSCSSLEFCSALRLAQDQSSLQTGDQTAAVFS